MKVPKPNNKFQLTEWKQDCPAVPNVLQKLVKEDIEDIMRYIQQLSIAQEFYSENIKLLLEAVTKHVL